MSTTGMTPDAMLTANALKAWRFLYRRGYIEGFGHLSACLSAGLGKPVWIDGQTAADAGAELLETRGPFRRVWAMVEAENGDAW